MAEDAKIDSGGGDCEDKTIGRLLFMSKNSNKATNNLTPKARLTFT